MKSNSKMQSSKNLSEIGENSSENKTKICENFLQRQKET